MSGALARGSLQRMPLWVLTILICSAVWVAGSVCVVLGATWLVRQPD